MPRPLLLCFTIVAGFQLQSANAAPVSEDLPVPDPVVAIARLVGLDPASDRARFVLRIRTSRYTPPPEEIPRSRRLWRLLLARKPARTSAD